MRVVTGAGVVPARCSCTARIASGRRMPQASCSAFSRSVRSRSTILMKPSLRRVGLCLSRGVRRAAVPEEPQVYSRSARGAGPLHNDELQQLGDDVLASSIRRAVEPLASPPALLQRLLNGQAHLRLYPRAELRHSLGGKALVGRSDQLAIAVLCLQALLGILAAPRATGLRRRKARLARERLVCDVVRGRDETILEQTQASDV
jgi:hypothetical protein